MKKIATISKIKILRALTPSTILCSLTAYFLVKGIFYSVENNSFRSVPVGIVITAACLIITIFYLWSLFNVVRNNFKGIYITNGYVYCYNFIYRPIKVSEITDIIVDKTYIYPRIVVLTKTKKTSIMTTVMVEGYEEIIAKIKMLTKTSEIKL